MPTKTPTVAARSSDPVPAREEAFHRITEMLRCKWTIAVIDAVDQGLSRPSAIQRSLRGLTAKVLHDRLGKLERYGLIERRRFAQSPPRVEIRFTARGRRLLRLIRGMRAFAEQWSRDPG